MVTTRSRALILTCLPLLGALFPLRAAYAAVPVWAALSGTAGHEGGMQRWQPLLSFAKTSNVSESQADSRFPALAAGDNDVHVVWEENGRILHRLYREGVWSAQRSVATGEQPALVVDEDGAAHLIFVNEFGGNYEIYYCRWNGTAWSLPRNVSNTSGVSSAPGVALGRSGALHAVWADNTPGFGVIYHAHWNGTYWINGPIPNATGGAPSIAVDAEGAVHVAWQDRDDAASPYDIYHCQRSEAGWTLPENLSDSSEEPSLSPSIAADGRRTLHVTWQERANGGYVIQYARGNTGAWSAPERLSDGESEAYLPCIAVGRGNPVYLGWQESSRLLYRQKAERDALWSSTAVVVNDAAGVSDLQLASDNGGHLHAVWTQRVSPGNWDVFYADLSFRLVLPLVSRDALR